jgi:hypothetical protein
MPASLTNSPVSALPTHTGVVRTVAPREAGGGGELHTVVAIGDGGVRAPLVEHTGVPAVQLASALRRAFDAVQLTQRSWRPSPSASGRTLAVTGGRQRS